MKPFPAVPALALLSVLAACGGQDAPAGDTNTSEPAPAAAPQPASANGLACATPGGARLGFNIGAIDALLCYGAPSAGGREIMGGIVSNGQPWELGADQPTTLHVASAVNVGGVALEAGSYSLYAIPGANQWTFFVNTNSQRPATPIDAGVRATEVGSFTVAPQTAPTAVDPLRYQWEPAAGGDPGGELILEWGTLVLAIPIEA